jgi:hypothetical protein
VQPGRQRGDDRGHLVQGLGGGEVRADRLEEGLATVRLARVAHARERVAEDVPARPPRLHRDAAPARSGARERPPLAEGDVEAGERDKLPERLDALGADGGAGLAGEAHERVDERRAGGVAIDPVDERAVELDHVGLEAHDALEAGVAGAGVVNRHTGAALAQRREQRGEIGVVLDKLMLGDLDDDVVERAVERGLDLGRGQRRRADVEGQVGTRRPARAVEREAQRAGLERRPQARAPGLGEPGVGGAAHRRAEAGERLVAGDAAGRERGDRLEDHLEPLGLVEERGDLGPAAVGDPAWIRGGRGAVGGGHGALAGDRPRHQAIHRQNAPVP